MCPGRAWRLGKALGGAEALEANVWEALRGSGRLGSLESLLTFIWGPELPPLPASAHSPCSTAPGSLSVGGWFSEGQIAAMHLISANARRDLKSYTHKQGLSQTTINRTYPKIPHCRELIMGLH